MTGEVGASPPGLTLRALRWRITTHALAFLVGLSAVFVALGFGAGLVSEALFSYGGVIQIVAGSILVFMGALMLGLIRIPLLQRDVRPHLTRKPGGYLGSALVGVAFAAGWTPCVGPILASILTLAGASGSGSQGGLLLGTYALGFAVPFLLTAQALTAWRHLTRYTGVIEKVGGVLLVLVGVVILTGWIQGISVYLASLGSLETVLLSRTEPGFVLAFLAGTLSFASPCVLPVLPSFLAYLTGVSADQMASLR